MKIKGRNNIDIDPEDSMYDDEDEGI